MKIYDSSLPQALRATSEKGIKAKPRKHAIQSSRKGNKANQIMQQQWTAAAGQTKGASQAAAKQQVVAMSSCCRSS